MQRRIKPVSWNSLFLSVTPSDKLVILSHIVLLLRHTHASWKTYFSLLEHSLRFKRMLENGNLRFVTEMKTPKMKIPKTIRSSLRPLGRFVYRV